MLGSIVAEAAGLSLAAGLIYESAKLLGATIVLLLVRFAGSPRDQGRR